MVVFYEGQKAIDPATFLSNFNHAFALVQPQLIDGEVRYRYLPKQPAHDNNNNE